MAGRGLALQQVPVKSENKDQAASKSSTVGCVLLRRESLFHVGRGSAGGSATKACGRRQRRKAKQSGSVVLLQNMRPSQPRWRL